MHSGNKMIRRVTLILFTLVFSTLIPLHSSVVEATTDTSFSNISLIENMECRGCHTKNRLLPMDGHHSNGFGKWQDSQCVGCHQEITDIAQAWTSGVKDKRFIALPVSHTSLKRIAKHGMPYLDVKKNVNLTRFDHYRLAVFLATPVAINPVEGSTYPKMIAFPGALNTEKTKAAEILSDELIDQGRKLYTQHCQQCHADKNPVAKRSLLGLYAFSEQWIHQYSNQLANTTDMNRSMPKISLNDNESKALFHFFGHTFNDQVMEINTQVSRMAEPKSKAPLNTQQTNYMWNNFFRDAGCVHCHGIKGRAQDKFDLTNNTSLVAWLTKNNPLDLWRRLEIRQIESELSIGHKDSGMPMTGAPLPRSFRDLVYRWTVNGCKDISGNDMCAVSI